MSTQSLHSATSVDDAPSSSCAFFQEGSEAASINVNEDVGESADPAEGVDEQDYSRYMPWIKVGFTVHKFPNICMWCIKKLQGFEVGLSFKLNIGSFAFNYFEADTIKK